MSKINIKARAIVNFKLNEILCCIENRVCLHTKGAFDNIFNGEYKQGIEHQHRKQAWEDLKQIFIKEAALPLPFDNDESLIQTKFKEKRNIAVDNILSLMHPSDRKKINSVVRIIEDCMGWCY